MDTADRCIKIKQHIKKVIIAEGVNAHITASKIGINGLFNAVRYPVANVILINAVNANTNLHVGKIYLLYFP